MLDAQPGIYCSSTKLTTATRAEIQDTAIGLARGKPSIARDLWLDQWGDGGLHAQPTVDVFMLQVCLRWHAVNGVLGQLIMC